MQRLCYLVAFVLCLGGCSAEASFDERYADTRKEIGEKAGEIDAELEQAEAAGTDPATARATATPEPTAER